MKTKGHYRLVNTKTRNTVYVTEQTIFVRKKDGTKEKRLTPVIAMCGYGPLGRSSRFKAGRRLDYVKHDIKILVAYPRRKKDLDNLRIEKFDEDGNILKTHSMEQVIRDIEQDLIIKKLKA